MSSTFYKNPFGCVLFQHDKVKLSARISPFASVGVEYIRVAGRAIVCSIDIIPGDTPVVYLKLVGKGQIKQPLSPCTAGTKKLFPIFVRFHSVKY